MTSKAVVSIFANAHASHSALNARYDPVTQSAVERVSNEAMRDPQAMSSEAVESAVSTMPTPTAMLDDPANSGEACQQAAAQQTDGGTGERQRAAAVERFLHASARKHQNGSYQDECDSVHDVVRRNLGDGRGLRRENER